VRPRPVPQPERRQRHAWGHLLLLVRSVHAGGDRRPGAAGRADRAEGHLLLAGAGLVALPALARADRLRGDPPDHPLHERRAAHRTFRGAAQTEASAVAGTAGAGAYADAGSGRPAGRRLPPPDEVTTTSCCHFSFAVVRFVR